jgi:hypothetical protein
MRRKLSTHSNDNPPNICDSATFLAALHQSAELQPHERTRSAALEVTECGFICPYFSCGVGWLAEHGDDVKSWKGVEG